MTDIEAQCKKLDDSLPGCKERKEVLAGLKDINKGGVILGDGLLQDVVKACCRAVKGDWGHVEVRLIQQAYAAVANCKRIKEADRSPQGRRGRFDEDDDDGEMFGSPEAILAENLQMDALFDHANKVQSVGFARMFLLTDEEHLDFGEEEWAETAKSFATFYPEMQAHEKKLVWKIITGFYPEDYADLSEDENKKKLLEFFKEDEVKGVFEEDTTESEEEEDDDTKMKKAGKRKGEEDSEATKEKKAAR